MGTLCSQAKVNCLSPDQTSLSPSQLTPEMEKLQEQKENYPGEPLTALLSTAAGWKWGVGWAPEAEGAGHSL